jgi:hypothetical protein
MSGVVVVMAANGSILAADVKAMVWSVRRRATLSDCSGSSLPNSGICSCDSISRGDEVGV